MYVFRFSLMFVISSEFRPPTYYANRLRIISPRTSLPFTRTSFELFLPELHLGLRSFETSGQWPGAPTRNLANDRSFPKRASN
jgi:hypothetical protein